MRRKFENEERLNNIRDMRLQVSPVVRDSSLCSCKGTQSEEAKADKRTCSGFTTSIITPPYIRDGNVITTIMAGKRSSRNTVVGIPSCARVCLGTAKRVKGGKAHLEHLRQTRLDLHTVHSVSVLMEGYSRDRRTHAKRA